MMDSVRSTAIRFGLPKLEFDETANYSMQPSYETSCSSCGRSLIRKHIDVRPRAVAVDGNGRLTRAVASRAASLADDTRELANHAERLRQPDRKPRPIGDDDQKNQHREKPRPYGDGELGDAHLGDAGCHIEIEADRRMAHADFHVDGHDDAEMHGIDAERHGDRKEDRGHDQHDRW